MTVCQGCGRACNSDLCCPTCASMNRSSFFCSQECFAGNWKEHGKLHAVIKQQLKLSELDDKERKIRGLNAASSAFSAISEIFRAPTPEKLHVSTAATGSKASTAAGSPAATFKDHDLRPVDRLVGPNGPLRGMRVFLLLSGIVLLTFLKINSLISEIPVVVESRAAKVSETMHVHSAAVGNSAVLVSPRREEKTGVPAVAAEDPEMVKSLRGEVAGLKAELENYKAMLNRRNDTEDAHLLILRESTESVHVPVLGESTLPVLGEVLPESKMDVHAIHGEESIAKSDKEQEAAPGDTVAAVGLVHAPQRLLQERRPLGFVRSA